MARKSGKPKHPLATWFVPCPSALDQTLTTSGARGNPSAIERARTLCVCKACWEDYVRNPAPATPPQIYTARAENYWSHMSACPFVYPLVKLTSMKHVKRDNDSGATEDTTDRPNTAKAPSLHDIQLWKELVVKFQHRHRLPDTWIEDPITVEVLEFLRSEVLSFTPTRKQIGGPLLKACSDAWDRDDKESMRQRLHKFSGRVCLLTDGWKNVAKTHVTGNQLSHFGVVTTFDVRPIGARHDGLVTAQDMESVIADAMDQHWPVGSVCTDDAGQCSRARRILDLRWSKIAFSRCFAHCVDNLVKSVLNTAFATVARQAADTVFALNNSSAKFLQLAHTCMTERYGKPLLFTACVQRGGIQCRDAFLLCYEYTQRSRFSDGNTATVTGSQ